MKNKFIFVLLICMLLCVGLGLLTACNKDVQNNSEHAHEYKKEVIASTCTTRGKIIYSCSCGDSKLEFLQPLGHEFISYNYNNDAKCSVDGTETSVCNRIGCGAISKITSANTALSHIFSTYISDNNATYEKDGTKSSMCDRDGCNYIDTIIDEDSKLIYKDIFKYGNSGVIFGLTEYGKTLAEIKIPKQIQGVEIVTISDNAFKDNNVLNYLEISNSVREIGKDAFQGCNALIKVNYLGDINQWASIKFKSPYSNPTMLTKDLYVNNKLLIDVKLTCVNVIGEYAFYQCKSIETVDLSNSVIGLSYCAFAFCESLEEIKMSDNLTYIEGMAFAYCKSLKMVEIPFRVTILRSNIFYNCSSLEIVKISSIPTNIHLDVFYGCSSLKEIYFIGKKTQWDNIDIEYPFLCDGYYVTLICWDGEYYLCNDGEIQ